MPDEPPVTSRRVTVHLAPMTEVALAEAVRLTGDTKTEAINKAVQVFAMIVAAQHKGGGVWLQDDDTAEPVKTLML